MTPRPGEIESWVANMPDLSNPKMARFNDLAAKVFPPIDPPTSLAKEIAELKEAIDDLVYWLKPEMGGLIVGKRAMEEYELLKARGR